MWLAQLDKTGDEFAIKLLQNIALFLGHVEQTGFPVAQAPHADAGGLQVIDQHARARHDAGQGVAEVLDVVVEDVRPLIALVTAHDGDGLVGAGAAVHQVVDIVEAGDVVVEEFVDGLLAVAGDEYGDRIPVNQHVAEIEDHVGDRLAGVRSGLAIRDQHVVIHIRLSRPTLHSVLLLAMFIL